MLEKLLGKTWHPGLVGFFLVALFRKLGALAGPVSVPQLVAVRVQLRSDEKSSQETFAALQEHIAPSPHGAMGMLDVMRHIVRHQSVLQNQSRAITQPKVW